MSKLDKEYFIKHFEAELCCDKNEFKHWIECFKDTQSHDDLELIMKYAKSICFNSDLLDVLKE